MMRQKRVDRMIQYNPRQWTVLKDGSPTQRKVFEILSETRLFEVLKIFDPAHVGTIGSDIDIPGSDIDIVCAGDDFAVLEYVLREAYGGQYTLNVRRFDSRGTPAITIAIPTEIPIEIYAENTPTELQYAYRHYLIACRILDTIGEDAHEDIRKLKRTGMKTEPAFASFLGLSGDPYQALLTIEQMNDGMIRMLRGARLHPPSESL